MIVIAGGSPAVALVDHPCRPCQFLLEHCWPAVPIGVATTATVLRSLAWLVNHAAERGLPLKQDDVVITGASIGAQPLHGKTVLVESDGFDLVSATFQ